MRDGETGGTKWRLNEVVRRSDVGGLTSHLTYSYRGNAYSGHRAYSISIANCLQNLHHTTAGRRNNTELYEENYE